jgi:hypothetical protein
MEIFMPLIMVMVISADLISLRESVRIIQDIDGMMECSTMMEQIILYHL